MHASQSSAVSTASSSPVQAARTALANKWFGSVPPKWAPRCDIYLHPTVVGYSRAAKGAESHPGHSSIGMDPKTGEVLNDMLRHPGPNREPVLTGQLFGGYGSLLPASPKAKKPVSGRDAELALQLSEMLDDHDDVQNVFSDFDLSDEEIARIAGSLAPPPCTE